MRLGQSLCYGADLLSIMSEPCMATLSGTGDLRDAASEMQLIFSSIVCTLEYYVFCTVPGAAFFSPPTTGESFGVIDGEIERARAPRWDEGVKQP